MPILLSQAGAVPVLDGRLCMVTSRSGKRWVFPKGIIDPGHTPGGAALLEAWEEAGIPADVARRASPAGAVHVRRALPDGLQRETIFVHDLTLSRHFVPINQDGEVVEHRRVDLYEAARLIAIESGPDEVTVDASLIVLDLLLRSGAIAPDASDYLALDALRFIGADAPGG